MDFGNALSFVFKDRDWFKKLFVGGILNFVSWYTVILFFIEFFPFGYAIDVIRKKANNIDPSRAKDLNGVALYERFPQSILLVHAVQCCDQNRSHCQIRQWNRCTTNIFRHAVPKRKILTLAL